MVLTAATISCGWTPARAQAAGDTLRQSLSLSLGAFNENRRDDADSPLAYAGLGLGERIDYSRNRGGRRWYLSLGAGNATIRPSASGLHTEPEEGFGAFTAGAGTDWRLRGSSARAGEFAVGVELQATVTVARHIYSNQDLTEQTFDFGAVTLAPTARWTRQAGKGAFTASLAMPLLAWVDHPYADMRFANQFVDLRFTPLTRFHEADGMLSYDFIPRGRYGLTAAYRVYVVELDDLQPVRRFTQALTIAVSRRFGPLP